MLYSNKIDVYTPIVNGAKSIASVYLNEFTLGGILNCFEARSFKNLGQITIQMPEVLLSLSFFPSYMFSQVVSLVFLLRRSKLCRQVGITDFGETMKRTIRHKLHNETEHAYNTKF